MNVLTYEQLKQRLDAVVAECVLAKAEVVCWAKECDRIVYRHTNQITDMHQLEAVKDLANLTPNVTAALAEVEMRGVEKLADAWDAETAKIMEGPFFYGQIERREAFSKYVRGYLVELREARV